MRSTSAVRHYFQSLLFRFLARSGGGVSVVGVCLLIARGALAAGEVPPSFSLGGTLFDGPASTTPLSDAAAVVRVQILNPAKTCILYDEQQTIDTSATDGAFSIRIGSSVGAAKRVGGSDPANTTVNVFQNKTAPLVTGCGGYTPTTGDIRYLRVIVTPSATGVPDTLTPDLVVGSVPSALVAERAENLQGLSRAQVLELGTVADLTQANVETVFSPTNFPLLSSLLAGTSTSYLSSSATGAAIPSFTAAPAGPSAGSVWYNSTSGKLEYYNGTAASSLVPLDSSGKLPAVDGSNLTNVAAKTLDSTLTTGAAGVFLNGGNSFGTSATIGTNDAQSLAFETGGSTRLTVDATGKVGIGNASPSYALQVEDTVALGTGTSNVGSDGNMLRPGSTNAWLNVKGGSGRAKIALGNDLVNIISGNSSGAIIFNTNASASTNIGTEAMRISGSSVGIGTASPSSRLHVYYGPTTLPQNATNSMYAVVTGPGDADGSSDVRAFSMDATGNGTNNLAGITAVNANAYASSTAGTVSVLQGGSFGVRHTNAATVTNGYGISAIPILSGSGSIGNYRAFWSRPPSISSTGGITTAYGAYLDSLYSASTPTAWGVYQAGASDKNYFAGQVGIGTNAPTTTADIGGSLRVSSGPTASTTLSAGINTTDTSITVASATGFPSAGVLYLTDTTTFSEAAAYTGLSGNTFTGVTRAYFGGTARTFSAGATVDLCKVCVASSATAAPTLFVTQKQASALGAVPPAWLGNGSLYIAGNFYTAGSQITSTYYNYGSSTVRLQGYSVGTTSDFFGVLTNNNERIRVDGVGGFGVNQSRPRGVVEFNTVPNTRLTASASAAATTLTVAANSFPASGTIAVEGEQMTYTGGGTTTLTVTRGVNATSAAAHASAVAVSYYGTADFIMTTAGNVGVGVTSPSTKLHVNGAILSSPATVTGASVDLSLSNTFFISGVGGSTITLSNMVNGGNYTLIVQDTTSRTYSFSGCTNQKFRPASAATTAGTHTIYSIVTYYNGTNYDCYINWATGYQ